jgi:hypothetical protein
MIEDINERKILYSIARYDKEGNFEGYIKNAVFDPNPTIPVYREINNHKERKENV